MGMTIRQMQKHLDQQLEIKADLQRKLAQQGDTTIRGLMEINLVLVEDAILLLEENIKQGEQNGTD